jgi:hypothetical protein
MFCNQKQMLNPSNKRARPFIRLPIHIFRSYLRLRTSTSSYDKSVSERMKARDLSGIESRDFQTATQNETPPIRTPPIQEPPSFLVPQRLQINKSLT